MHLQLENNVFTWFHKRMALHKTGQPQVNCKWGYHRLINWDASFTAPFIAAAMVTNRYNAIYTLPYIKTVINNCRWWHSTLNQSPIWMLTRWGLDKIWAIWNWYFNCWLWPHIFGHLFGCIYIYVYNKKSIFPANIPWQQNAISFIM